MCFFCPVKKSRLRLKIFHFNTHFLYEQLKFILPKGADNTDAETIKQYDAGLLMHLDRSCYKKAKAFVAQWFLASIFFANIFILFWLCYFLSHLDGDLLSMK